MELFRRIFRLREDSSSVIWGHRFTWTDQHPTEAEVKHLLYSYDELGSAALDRLDELSPPATKGWKCPHGKGPGQRDLYALLKDNADHDETLGRLWRQVSEVPEWVDWDQIERAQSLVHRYNVQILIGLLFKSLLGGMGASRVVETLARTGGFGVQVTRRRLLETLQHFMECTSSLGSIQPGGEGFVSTVRVRLLHAAVRRRIMQLEAQQPGYFDVDKLGVPINDLHSIGTISVYSTTIVYLALPRQGVFLSESEIKDFLALWRWVGHLLGTPVDWLADPVTAKAMMEAITTYEVKPSPKSQILADNILIAESNVPPMFAAKEFLAAQAYRLNGHDLAGALGIEKPPMKWRFLVTIQCWFLLFISTIHVWLPEKVRRAREERSVRRCRMLILSQKAGGISEPSKFDFQYIPNHGQTTERGAMTKTVAALRNVSDRYDVSGMLVIGLTGAALAAVAYCVRGHGLFAVGPVQYLATMISHP